MMDRLIEGQVTRQPLSSRWILEFEKQVQRRKHVLLYGNIHDQFLWRDEYLSLPEFLPNYFTHLGFDLVLRYDMVDGFRFADEPVQAARGRQSDRPTPTGMSRRFEDIVRHGVIERNPGLSGREPSPAPSGVPVGGALPGGPGGVPASSAGSAPMAPQGDLTTPPTRQGPGLSLNLSGGNRRVQPEEAFGNLRLVLGQTGTSAVALVDLCDMLATEPDRFQGFERPPLMLLKKAALEAAVIRQGRLIGYRNTLVFTASDLKRVPDWIYRDNPFISLIHVPYPAKEERRQFAVRFLRPSLDSGGFFGGDQISDVKGFDSTVPSELETVAEEFADLTEGFQAMDLEALRHTSWREEIPVVSREVWRLIDFFKFGVRQDPWEQLKPDKVRTAKVELSRSVIGQPAAVNAVTTMLTAARVGLSIGGSGTGRSGRPKGVFFFVGPTGVGKTELAKAVSKLVFGDERSFARFDMSEYKEEHAAEKLAGAPPGYLGYEDGGLLTNRVIEQPYSILLFDEIEKAHPRVLDKFLQILEDGRLTDGKGQTAYFNQTAIIFTSNIGASDLTDARTGNKIREGIMSRVSLDTVHQFSYEQVAAHFRVEVDWFFTSRIGRAELLSRLGDNIVVFDLLRPEFIHAIGQKFLTTLAATAQEKFHLTLHYRSSILEVLAERMEQRDNLLFGGRRIKSLLESLVERPLNGWIFANVPDLSQLAGQTLEVGLTNQGVLEVCHVAPVRG